MSEKPAKRSPARELAARYRAEVRAGVERLGRPLRLVGFLSSKSGPSRTYARYTRSGCEDVGIEFELRELPRLELEDAVRAANEDAGVHGIMIYYPVFESGQDRYLKDLVDYRKDIEGLGSHWIRLLYDDVRTVEGDPLRKAIVPCTPLAVLKLLNHVGGYAPEGRISNSKKPFAGLTATVFNRSEVVGRPLASMIANDGARVFSFDVHGPVEFGAMGKASETAVTRAEALAASQIVVAGVPSEAFEKIRAEELRQGAVAVCFSTIKNFAPEVRLTARAFVPRVGPVTVAMCLRNTLRLYRNFHGVKA